MYRIRKSAGRRWALGNIGQRDSATEFMHIAKTGSQFGNDLPSALTLNNRNGIKSLLQPYMNDVSARSPVVLHQTVSGSPESLTSPLQFSPNTSGISLCSGNKIVLRATGTVSAPDAVTTTWSNDGLQLGVTVPERINGAGSYPPAHLAHIAVRPLA
ncbi:hypothetical protein [Paraburkholderia dilworthii]|uniref:hypothetical protein n=1 Tax=Paraburkholderia dilworthii TaxID=948106 RepID=UPI000486CE05|nr:hypothetical protein [Paraburkholderia dilworthii]